MNKFSVAAVSLLVAVFFYSAGARAELQDQGTYVLDTDTGFKWVKPTETLGSTIADGFAEMTPYGDFAGCRYPVQSEINDLIGKTGIPEGGWCGGYCGLVDPAYAELLENAIRLFGDTRDVAFDADGHSTDVAPDGAGFTRAGYSANPYGVREQFLLLADNELVDRASGLPLSDGNDQIFEAEDNLAWDGNGATGLMMICDTWPTLPVEATRLNFEGLTPGTAAPFTHRGYRIAGDATVTDSATVPLLPSQLEDAQTRVIATTPCPECVDGRYYQTSITISKADGGPFAAFDLQAFDLTMNFYPFGDCYFGGSDADDRDACNWSGTTTWGEVLNYRGRGGDYPVGTGAWLSLQELTVRYTSHDGVAPNPRTCNPPCQTSIDNIIVADAVEIEVDFNPWSPADIIDPTSNALITVQIDTTPTFDSADVNPGSLYLGTGRAQVASAVLTNDLDGDGDTDHIFGFRTADTGISCLDRTMVISGQKNDGTPFAQQFDVNISDNCFETVEIEVEPFAPNNYVYPDADYIMQVKLNHMEIAAGDPVNLDPDRSVAEGNVRLGVNGALNQFDPALKVANGSDFDVVFGFEMTDTGIACGDVEVELVGLHTPSYYSDDGPFPSGKPAFRGTDTIVTQDCDDSCHP